MKLAIAVVLAAGCTQYTRVSMSHAPGSVDLAAPLPHENGDPKRFEPPSDPGTHFLVVAVAPMLMLGNGRGDNDNKAVVEPGLEMRFERHDHVTDGHPGKDWVDATFALTAGLGVVQVYSNRTEIGAFYAELNYRFPIKGAVPMDIGVGPAVYAADTEVGAQLTVRLPLLSLRARYLARNGVELWAGYEVPIPFIFGRSR